MGDATTYWATIAQVTPVLALALVIEVRVVARRIAQDPGLYQRTRSWRLYAGAMYGAAAVALTSSFLTSLIALRDGEKVDDYLATISLYACYVAFLIVVAGPLMLIIQGLVGDRVMSLHRSMPYSRAARQRRMALDARDTISAQVRRMRVGRLRDWGRLAQLYTEATHRYSSIDSEAPGVRHKLRLREKETFADLDEIRGELIDERRSMDDIEKRITEAVDELTQRTRISDADMARLMGLLTDQPGASSD